MNCDETRDLLPADVDNELGARDARDVARHLAQCEACRADRAALQSLRRSIGIHASRHEAPASLRARVEAAFEDARHSDVSRASPPPALSSPPDARTPRMQPRRWFEAGAMLATAIVFAVGVGLYAAVPSADERLADEVISGHIRSLQLNRAVDVASSDQHTVKPWFNGKLDYSPPVRDLTTEGFPLVGGRLDYVDQRPVAALVYRHRQHAINVYVLPAPDATDAPARSYAQRGYHVLAWTRDGMRFWAVSDVDPSALAELARLFPSPG